MLSDLCKKLKLEIPFSKTPLLLPQFYFKLSKRRGQSRQVRAAYSFKAELFRVPERRETVSHRVVCDILLYSSIISIA